jgi:hypothetical protein
LAFIIRRIFGSVEVAEGKLNIMIFIVLYWYRKPGAKLDPE